MRGETEVQSVADKASSEIDDINDAPLTADSRARREYLRTVLDALDWVLEYRDDDPL